jgi:ribosomal protein S18 acetylase RimI-like enzyme
MVGEDTAEQHVREFARAGVRAGLLSPEELHDDVREAIVSELADRAGEADDLATAWIDEAREQLRVDQESWPEATDYERLQTAFDELEIADIVVLQGCEDHWVAKRLLEERRAADDLPRGVAWFTPSDVWHAVDEGMLEVNLWHATTANAAPGDELLSDVLGVLEKHGLAAHFDEGRIEVDAHWHKRIRT